MGGSAGISTRQLAHFGNFALRRDNLRCRRTPLRAWLNPCRSYPPMPATRILPGARYLVIFSIVLATTWGATQWTAGDAPSRAGQHGSRSEPCLSMPRPPSSGGGISLTPMRRRFSSKAPASPRRAACLDPRGNRHVGRTGARGKERRHRWLGALGDARRSARRAVSSDKTALCLGASSATICATMGRNMSLLCADPFRQRRRPRRADAADLARLHDCSRHQGRELELDRRLAQELRARAAVRSDQRPLRCL